MPISDFFYLPPAPAQETGNVKAWSEPVVIETYEPAAAQKNPMFLEKRVYQGSSGRIYPLPFVERVSQTAKPREWQAVHIENDFVRLMILSEVGGRIHVGLDKTNGYDFFYRQNVIKPALVGLAGPWVSGGVEFNWPQHHRPATYMSTEVRIERHHDGSATVWCSDHDPLERMKAAHGICLHPSKALVELKVRLYNRTVFTQTFLWWANVAVHVDENYQSFFPPDVHFVADHAKRAISEYPFSKGTYYGIDYAARAQNGTPARELPPKFPPRSDVAPNDLSWYANLPVPTSYMAIGSTEDFFGGYDHGREAGLVHVANHRIAPGKKQWTWGNSEFGYAWDRNLTERDGPYIELMAGVYTDNQPDFSFLAPGETKTFRQYWYPIQKIGVPQKANRDGALTLSVEGRTATVRICVTERQENASVILSEGDETHDDETHDREAWIASTQLDLNPGPCAIVKFELGQDVSPDALYAGVRRSDGSEVISYTKRKRSGTQSDLPEPASEPPAPDEIASVDELFLTGLHLSQYRHATRSPELYWREALRRDPSDSQSNEALGTWYLRRGQFIHAEQHLRTAIARLTIRNPHPQSGRAHYHLGLALRFQERDAEAYDAFYKCVWNFDTRGPGYHALAELDCKAAQWALAWEHLQLAVRSNTGNMNARNLATIVLRRIGDKKAAVEWNEQTLAEDPTDPWANYLCDHQAPADNQLALDLAFDTARAGLFDEACATLGSRTGDARDGTEPLRCYALAYFCSLLGKNDKAEEWRRAAQQVCVDYCFPNRLEEMSILEWAVATDTHDARARYLLGNFLYDRRRYAEAIGQWEASAAIDATFPTVWRNLGIGCFNAQGNESRARDAFDKAFALDQNDGRVFYERDQLCKRLGVPADRRLAEFQSNMHLVADRDDLSVELSALCQLANRFEDSLNVLRSRRFQPWEGGEGLALAQHVRAYVALGRLALAQKDAHTAKRHFESALSSPENLGEAKHPLANYANVHYWLGAAHDALGEEDQARQQWREAARVAHDFQGMSVVTHSEMSYYRALALQKLGREDEAKRLLKDLYAYAEKLSRQKAKIDYFATSLPAMLLFDEDLHRKNELTARFLSAQAVVGLGDRTAGLKLLHAILETDPNHALAADFLTEIGAEETMPSQSVPTR